MAGLTFAHPLWLAALSVPLVWTAQSLRRSPFGLPLPTFAALAELSRRDRSSQRLAALRAAALCLLVLAMADPGLPGRWVTERQFKADIMLALDISGSMAAEDLVPNRVEAAKRVLSDFVGRNQDERLGLVVFKARALTLSPLTTDTGVVASALAGVTLGTLADDGTAIGDAIGTCLNRLAGDRPAPGQGPGRLIVLLTDGENNSGMLSPLDAAAIARARGVKIDTIAVGKPGGAPVPFVDAFGRRDCVRNPDGSVYLTTIDENTLRQIAARTGGLYFRAGDTAGLAAAYQQISGLTRTARDVHRHRHRTDLAAWLLAPALVLLLLEFWLGNGRWRRLGALAVALGTEGAA